LEQFYEKSRFTEVFPMKKLLPLLLALSLCAGCGPAAAEDPTPTPVATAAPSQGAQDLVTFTDDLGQELSIPRPQRVAALLGSFADIWCVSGGEDKLVAASKDTWTSIGRTFDHEVADLGAITAPGLETLLAAQPDFILASSNTDSNLELKDTLAQAGIPTAYFDVQTFEDYLRVLEVCTQLSGHPENYETYGTALRGQIDAALARQDGSAPTVLCLRVTGSACKVKGTKDYLLGEMLSELGCVNVADRDESLVEGLSMEAILAADPDYIFAVFHGSDPTDAQAYLDEVLLSNPAWESLRAVQNGNYHALERALFAVKPNARWGEAYETLADILYPAA